MSDAAKFGYYVWLVRKRLGITQQQLANQAGLSRNQISLIENGHVWNPELLTLKRLARALGTKTTNLVRLLDDDA